MTYQQAEDRSRLRRQRSELAIRLAMQSKWDEAVAANRSILSLFPDDVDAWNRLGKALTELGRYGEAREAYGRALAIDPANSIAKKNLDRLSKLSEAEAAPVTQKSVDPQLFIEETGKSGQTVLVKTDPKVLARATAGDPVELKRRDNQLIVDTVAGEYLGEVEPRLALRLSRLMEGGNRYAAAVTSIEDSTARIIIKEIYQHPTQAGKPSFPTSLSEVVRPYTKESLLRYGPEEEDEEIFEEISDSVEDWEETPEAEAAGPLRLSDVEAAETIEEEEFEE
jgi:hypothetical protein